MGLKNPSSVCAGYRAKGLAKGARWTLLPASGYWSGETEMDIEAAIRLHRSIRGATCWDLGTHFGIYTVGMALAVGREGKVVGFEPDPFSFKRCQLHIKMNSLDWVKVFNAAVSDSEGTDQLLLINGTGASTSHFAYEDERFDESVPSVKVRTVVLDKLVERSEIPTPQFIKVDVEGHGTKALRGAIKTISKTYPTLVMSFHSVWELEGTRELLEPLGYRSFNIQGEEQTWSASLYQTAILRRIEQGN